MACTFSLLAAALAVNLTDTLWAVSGPISSMVEFVLRFLVWLYTFSLCALSLYLAITALRQEAKQAETRWSLLALAIAVLATVLSLYSYWIP
jgi:hypothetical protein